MKAQAHVNAFNSTAQHMRTFSALIAADPEIRDLNMRHLQMLAEICQRREPISVGALGILIDMPPYVTSRLIDKLHERKLVDRIEAEDDRRRKQITATLAGHALDARVLAFFDEARRVKPSASAAA
jgi:DNA-binding MarR family transcriptional regulator